MFANQIKILLMDIISVIRNLSMLNATPFSWEINISICDYIQDRIQPSNLKIWTTIVESNN